MRRVLLLGALLALAAPASGSRVSGGDRIALVTAETENELLAVAVPGGQVLRRIHLPTDPENVEARLGLRIAVVVSTRGAAVSLIDTRTLRVARILRGFRSPHIASITPNGRYAYVTDDARGKLVVIDLHRRREVSHVFVGFGAHHMTISPDGRTTWVALGERARRLIVLDTSRPAQPRTVAQIHLGDTGHDLAFTPSGARVWVTSDTSSRVGVYDAHTHRLLKTFSGGSPPQHVAFVRAFPQSVAVVTSGYAGTMQLRNARTGRLLRRLSTDYGSFNIGLGDNYVLTSSLMRGTLTGFNVFDGHRLGEWHIAPATRDVALTGRR